MPRASRAANPAEHAILAEVISKEPLGPAVRHGDDGWFDIVKWSLFAMIDAEELELTSENIDKTTGSANPLIQRFIGAVGESGKMLGLDNRWAYRIIKHVGNYGEIFERNVGQGSQLKIGRGLNGLWSKGGLQYAPPIR